tara:strand:- start:76 stop:225 length:150 start_codon:yes stop_codon:yes gene_type:complete
MIKKTFIKLNNEPNIPEDILSGEELETSIDENKINTETPNLENLELDDN